MQRDLIKAMNPKGGMKLAINSICYSRTGSHIAGGCVDGSLQIWETRLKSYHRP